MSKKCFLERSAAQAHTGATSKALRIKQKEKVNDELASLSSTNATTPDLPRSLPHIVQNFPPTPESPELPSPLASVRRKRDWQDEDADVAMVNAFRENSSQESRQEGALSIPFDPGEEYDDARRRESLESASSQASFSSPTSPTSPPATHHTPPKKQKREGKDEKIAREKGLNIFMSVYDIINIQMDEFNECLEQYKGGILLSSLLGPPDPDKTQLIQDPETGENKAKLTEEQATLAREIRRRGKNKNAAQECRKRSNEKISQLKKDVEGEREKKEKWRQESAQLAQELRHWEEKNRQQDNLIMRQFNYPTDRFMLVDDPATGKVEFKRIPEEINRGPPPNLIRIPRHDPPPLLQLGNSMPGVTLQPVASFESYERMPVPPSSSLYPMHAVSHRNLPPSVQLFPVALLRNGVRPYPMYSPGTPPGTRYSPGWNLRRGPAPVPSPADPAINSNRVLDPNAHRRLESPTLDRRQESIRAGFSRLADENQLVDSPEPEPELVIKEEQPEDLSIVSEKDVSIIDRAGND